MLWQSWRVFCFCYWVLIMQYFYDQSRKVFLVDSIHAIPSGAIAVSEQLFKQCIDGRSEGRDIIVNQGKITLTPPRPTSIHSWDGKAWVVNNELVQKQRVQICQDINNKRDSVDASGVFVESLGKWLDSDSKAYQNILGVKASLDLLGDITIEWTWADNTNSTISKQDLAVMVSALLQAKQANHANAIKHKQAVMQSSNPLEYDYSTGWTKTYVDFIKEQGND